MNSATINSLTTLVRARLRLANMNTVSDTDIKSFLRSSLSSLREKLVSKWRDYYVAPPTYIALVANQETYALPEDFRAEHTVFLVYGSGPNKIRTELQPFAMNKFQSYLDATMIQPVWPLAFRIIGRRLLLTPTPSQDYPNAIELWYTPQWQPPLSDVDTIDDVMPNGWERWIELDTCVQIAAALEKPAHFQMYSNMRAETENMVMTAANIRVEDPMVMEDAYEGWGGLGFGNPGSGTL